MMRLRFLCFGAVSAASLMLLGAPANSQTSMTSQQAQDILQKHAEAGKIVILYGTVNGSYLLERPATGIISTDRCRTDFAAPRPTRLVNFTNPATHFNVVWSDLLNVRIDGDAVSFNSSGIGPDKFAKLAVSDNAARAEVWRAVQTLARNCGAQMALADNTQVRSPIIAKGAPVANTQASLAKSPSVSQLQGPAPNDTGGQFRLRDGKIWTIPSKLQNWRGARRNNNGDWDGYFYLELRGSEPWIRVELELFTADHGKDRRSFQEVSKKYQYKKDFRAWTENIRTKTGSIKMDCSSYFEDMYRSRVAQYIYGARNYSIILEGHAANAGENGGIPQIRSFLAETSFN